MKNCDVKSSSIFYITIFLIKSVHNAKNILGDIMKEKRLITIFTAYALCSALLVGACGVICFVKGETYTKSAVSQRSDSIVIKHYRGKIYDRGGVPLVDNTVVQLRLDENAGINLHSGEPLALVPERYSENSIARHIIGYVDSDGVGVSGVEKAYESILASSGADSLDVMKSANGKIIAPLSFREKHPPAGSVTLTIDSHIQRLTEDVMKKREITGAVVILDTKTFDILAMASTPDYNQNDISPYLNSDGGEFVNRCIMPYNAGSIFKIVTMCAAGERAKLCRQYTCDGFFNLDNHTFSCNKEGGHGMIGCERAFSESCNCAFYKMGLDVGADAILSTAKKFGIGTPVITDGDFLGETHGNVPDVKEITDTVNYSIGQGEILITPVQAANMVCIIANGGVAGDVNIISQTSDATGKITLPIPDTQEVRISKKTSEYVKNCMISAVKDGTGKLLSQSEAKIAGKTGTAATGWEVGGRTLVHGWFCGFFPYDNPQYAMAVLVEDGGSGAASAAPVFGEIAEEIMKFYP